MAESLSQIVIISAADAKRAHNTTPACTHFKQEQSDSRFQVRQSKTTVLTVVLKEVSRRASSRRRPLHSRYNVLGCLPGVICSAPRSDVSTESAVRREAVPKLDSYSEKQHISTIRVPPQGSSHYVLLQISNWAHRTSKRLQSAHRRFASHFSRSPRSFTVSV